MSFKERWDKLGDRIKMLVQKYPLVAASMIFVGGVLGFILGKIT